MSFLSTTHTNYIYGSYLDDILSFIKAAENNDLFRNETLNIAPQADNLVNPNAGNAFIGYGFDLLENEPSVLANYLSLVIAELVNQKGQCRLIPGN